MTRSPVLHLSSTLTLPIDVAGEAIGLLATRGAGKSFTSAVLTEELFGHGIQVVVVDPAGVYWGLQSSYDGKRKGLDIYVLGGLHGDLPLEPTAGKLIADLIVDSGHSFVLDLSAFESKGDQTLFVTAFADRLYARKGSSRTTLHLILDEADEFAPQKPLGIKENTMLNRVARIVRRGRSRGLGCTLITQRSATLNKDVLDLVETLVVMRMPGPRDREQVKGWISVKDLRDELGVDEALPGLPTGTAFVWSPVRGLLKKTKVRRINTFDSYRTPKPGETAAEPAARAELDLAALGEQIAATVERAKADDPRELRQRIAELEAQLSEPLPITLERITVKVPVFDGEVDRLEIAAGALAHISHEIAEAGRDVADAMAPLTAAIQEAKKLSTGLTDGSSPDVGDALRHPDAGSTPASSIAAPARTPRPSAKAGPSPQGPASPSRLAGAGILLSPVTGPQQRVLDALAWLQAVGLDGDRVRVAFLAGYSSKGKHFQNLVYALKGLGLVDYPTPGAVRLTDAGDQLASHPARPGTPGELQAAVLAKLSGPQRRILEVLIGCYPNGLTREQLAVASGYSAGGKHFQNLVYAVKGFGIAEYPEPGMVRAAPILFLEGRA